VSPRRTEPVTPAEEPDRDDLLARIARLEAENAALRTSAEPSRRRGGRGRSVAVVALVLVAALLAPVAVSLAWGRGLVTNPERYVETVAPLADDPAVQAAITDRVTAALADALNADALVQGAADALDESDLPPAVKLLVRSLGAPLVDALRGRVRSAVASVVASDAFTAAWREANRTASEQLVAVLRGDPDAIAQLDEGGTLSVNLASVIDVVRQRLSDDGFGLVDRLPPVTASFPLMSNGDLVRLRGLYRAIDLLGTALVWFVLALLGLAVWLARDRPRTLMISGFVLALAAVILGAGINVGRGVYTAAAVGQVARPDAAVVVYDQVVSGLRLATRTTLALGLVVALVGLIAGRSAAAGGLRAAMAKAGDAAGRNGVLARVQQGPVGGWLARHRTVVRAGVGVLAGLALVLADRLTTGLILWVAGVAAVVLVVVQVLSAPPEDEPVDGPAEPERQEAAAS
jgi:hypothetical protein